MRSRGSNSRRITLFLFSVSLYLVVKFLLMINEDHRPGADTILNGLFKPPAGTGVTYQTVVSTSFPLWFLDSSNSNCSSEYLEAPQYVKSVGCSGFNGWFCEALTCRNLLTGTDNKVYEVAKQFMDKYPRKFQTNEEVAKAAEDCDNFKRSRGYRTTALSEEDAAFSIAFNILVHTNVGQMERLLRSIYRPQHFYCIHVDGKSPVEFLNAVKKVVKCFDNVFISSKLEKIVYAGFTRLQADINCMADHVKRSSWKYLINTAAQSFPLHTPEEMVQILKVYNGANDIEGIHGGRVLRFRFELEWEERTDTMTVNKTGKSHSAPPHEIDIVRGSAFGVFSRAFVEFILSNNRSLDLLEWSKKTYSPDEHFWATLHHTYTNPHLHTPGGYSGSPNDKPWLAVFVKWGLSSNCHGKFVRGVCILGVADLPDLVVRKELFVNKFYDDYQPLALDCLEAWIRHKETCPIPVDLDFYRSLPFVKKY